MRRDYFRLVLVLFLTTMIVGCNMFKGAGKDIEQTGENIQDTVDRNK